MRRRNTARRRSPNPLVVMISIGLMLSLVVLVLWPKPKSPKKTTQKTRTAIHATQHKPHTIQKAARTPQPQAGLHTSKVYAGKVRGALPRSMRDKLSSEDARFLSALAARLLIWKLDLRRDLRRGDHIRILYQPVKHQSRFQILAMQYKSQKHGKTFHYYRYKEANKKFDSFYDKQGRNVELQLKNSPLRTYEQVTSILKMRRRHKGIDFKTPTGTKLYLPYRSRVIRRTWNFRYNGNSLEVEFLRGPRPGTRALFLHLQKIKKNIKPGRVFRAGTLIGFTGNTGRSTAPHLHYQLQTRNARRIFDPYKLQGTYIRTLPASEMANFQQHRKELERKMQ